MIFILISLLLFGCKEKEIPVTIIGGDNMSMNLTSPAFQNNGMIPSKYTCDGEDVNPPLEISGVPSNAKSLLLIVDDPDAPMATWNHWIVWNIPIVSKIEENSVPNRAILGINDFDKHMYGGPCPPSGTHRYMFKLYALDTTLSLDSNSEKNDVLKAMEGHILEQTVLVGLYKKT